MAERSADQIDRIRARRIGCSLEELREREARLEAWCPGCARWLSEVDDFAGCMSRSSGRQAECRSCCARRRNESVRGDAALTGAIVREAADLYWWGASSAAMAAHYGVSRAALLHAIARRPRSRLRADDLEWMAAQPAEEAAKSRGDVAA